MVYIFFSVFCLIVSNIKIKKWLGRRKRCILRIRVKVVKILTRKPLRGNGLLYKPIFKIVSLKHKSVIRTAYYTNLYRFNLGDELWIYVNPHDVQDFMFESPYRDIGMFVDALACIMPLSFMLI